MRTTMRAVRAPMKLVVSVALLAVAGCSAKSDFEKICNAEQLSGASEGDPSMKAVKMAEWLRANIHSSQAKDTLSGLAVSDSAARGEVLKMAAREAGYTGPCPMADAK